MKISVEKKNIIETLANIQGITGKRSSLAITENILITAQENKISICATDIETGFEGIYPADVEKEGVVTINAKYFYDIVKKISGEKIYIKEGENRLVMISDTEDGEKLKYNILGAEPDDFPQLPKIEEVSYIEVDSLLLKNMIMWATMVTPGATEKRAHIVGACLEIIDDKGQNKIRMISTDGKRLTKTQFQCKIDDEQEKGKKIIIPKKALSELFKFLKEKGKTKIGIKDNYFIVKNKSETIYVNILSGQFPDLTSLFKDEKRIEVKLKKNRFKDMLERMAILTSDNYKGVFFKFDKNRLVINAANPEKGEAFEYMEIDFKDKKKEMMFNPYYFIDAINIIEGEDVLIKIKDEHIPCIVCGIKNQDNINIIMPMKI